MYTPQTTFAGQNPFYSALYFEFVSEKEKQYRQTEEFIRKTMAPLEKSPRSGLILRYLRSVRSATFSDICRVAKNRSQQNVLDCLTRLKKAGAVECQGSQGYRVYWVTEMAKTPVEIKPKEWQINVCAGFIPKY